MARGPRHAKAAEYMQLYTTDDLRHRWQSAPGAATGSEPPIIELRDGVTISRDEAKAEIRRRDRRERRGYRLLMLVSLVAAAAAVVAAIEGWRW